LTNGNGVFKVSSLRKGQYAFANGNISLSIDSPELANSTALVYPSPASSSITLESNAGADLIKILDLNGRTILSKSLNNELDISLDLEGWAEGAYVVVWYKNQISIDSARFIISH
jgi:hypothetical protein